MANPLQDLIETCARQGQWIMQADKLLQNMRGVINAQGAALKRLEGEVAKLKASPQETQPEEASNDKGVAGWDYSSEEDAELTG